MENYEWVRVTEELAGLPAWAKEASLSLGGALFSEFKFEGTEKGSLRFRRLTEKQRSYFSVSVLWGPRTFYPAGIYIRLPLNSYGVRIQFQMPYQTRNYAAFELVQDNFTVALHNMEYTAERTEISLRCPADEKTDTSTLLMYLPQSVGFEIKSLTWLDQNGEKLADPIITKTDARSSRPFYLALGDSITQGMDARFPTSTFPNLLANYFDWDCLNQGVGGHGFDVASLADELPRYPSVITVAYGTNNWNGSMEASVFLSRAEDYLKQVHQRWPDAVLFVISPFWRADWRMEKKTGPFKEMHKMIESVVSGWKNTHLINGFDVIPHVKQPYFEEDGVHPTDLGFSRFALEMIKLIHKTIQSENYNKLL